MVRPYLVAAAVLATTAPARADGDEQLSIAQLVEVAVQQSSTLTRVRAGVRQGELGTAVAGGAAQWRIQASVGVDTRREATIPNAKAQVIEDTRVTGSVGVGKQLFTGGDVTLSVSDTDELRRFGEAPDAPANASFASVSLALRQPLLRGRGQGASVDIKVAGLSADIATLQARDEGAATIRDLIEAYWELAYARANLEVRKQSLALAQSQLEMTRKMDERGAVPASAVKSARYGVAVREEAIVRARDGLDSASLYLRRIAGLEIGVDVGDLIPTEPLVVPAMTVDVSAAIATGLARNPRIAAAQRGVGISDVELKRRRNAALPSIDLGATAGANGVGADRGAAFDAVRSGSSYQLGGNVSMSWEVGGAASAAAEIARIARANARVSAKDVEREVIASVIDAARRLRAAQARAVLARRAIELAMANLDTEISLFRADKSNNVLVFGRQTELDEARLLESRAAADCLIALASLDYLTGQLLDRHGVEIIKPTRRSSR